MESIIANYIMRVKKIIKKTSVKPRQSLLNIYEELSRNLEEKPYVVATGYGRELADFADKKITEITCHGKGAKYFNEDGIIFLDDDFDLSTLTKDLYYSKIEAVKDNFERVKNLEMADDTICRLIERMS